MTDDFVARHDWNTSLGQLPVNHMQVSAADAAGVDSDQNLVPAGPRDRAFNHFKSTGTGSRQHVGSHT
jgi:hypothetical protein